MQSRPRKLRRIAALLGAALVGFAIWGLTLWGGAPVPMPAPPPTALPRTTDILPASGAATAAALLHTQGDGAEAGDLRTGVQDSETVTPDLLNAASNAAALQAGAQTATGAAASAGPVAAASGEPLASQPSVTAAVPSRPTVTPAALPDPPAVDITGLTATGAGVNGDGEPSEPAIDEAFERRLADLLRSYRTMGAVVCVFQYGRVTDTFTYGQLDPAGTPVTADTMFRVGSISKMVAALGVVRLVQDGRATLDGDI